jgi:hypothetical protein
MIGFLRPLMIPRVEQDPKDAARYIGRFAGDLKRMAAGAELGFLAYLLAMVEEEANAEAEGRPLPPEAALREGQTKDTR